MWDKSIISAFLLFGASCSGPSAQLPEPGPPPEDENAASVPEDASYDIVDDRVDGKYFYFVFRDNHMVSSILLGDTTLAAAVKETVEKRLDCAQVLRQDPGCKEILAFLGEM